MIGNIGIVSNINFNGNSERSNVRKILGNRLLVMPDVRLVILLLLLLLLDRRQPSVRLFGLMRV